MVIRFLYIIGQTVGEPLPHILGRDSEGYRKNYSALTMRVVIVFLKMPFVEFNPRGFGSFGKLGGFFIIAENRRDLAHPVEHMNIPAAAEEFGVGSYSSRREPVVVLMTYPLDRQYHAGKFLTLFDQL